MCIRDSSGEIQGAVCNQQVGATPNNQQGAACRIQLGHGRDDLIGCHTFTDRGGHTANTQGGQIGER